MARFRIRRRGGRGYTLLEMLLVVAVLASLVALSIPALRNPLGRTELIDAAQTVRGELLRTRLDAIESGTVRQFHFQPGGRRYEVASKSDDGAGGELSFSTTASSNGSPAAVGESPDEPLEFQLPKGITFCDEAGAKPPQIAIAREPAGAVDWSSPVIFYPNGRTSNARIRLHVAGQWYIDVTLRGVTGSVGIGKLMQEEEQP